MADPRLEEIRGRADRCYREDGIGQAAADVEWLLELIDAAAEALKKALEWEGELNSAEQLMMQHCGIEARKIKRAVSAEMDSARALLAKLEGERDE